VRLANDGAARATRQPAEGPRLASAAACWEVTTLPSRFNLDGCPERDGEAIAHAGLLEGRLIGLANDTHQGHTARPCREGAGVSVAQLELEPAAQAVLRSLILPDLVRGRR
jgi:hypothetical protein